MTRPHRTFGRDDGSILPMVAGFGALALLVVVIVTAATSLYLERKRLLSLADVTALAGAEAFDLNDVAVTEAGPRPVLTDAAVASAVAEQLASHPPSGFDQLHIDAASTPDGRTASVTLSSTWRPPMVALFLPDGIRIDATATARSVFG